MSIWAPDFDACEVYGSRVETYTRDVFEATVEVELLYQNAPAFLYDIIEKRRPYPLTRSPFNYPPELTAEAYLKAASITQIPDKSGAVGGIGEVYEYNIARVLLNYSTAIEKEDFTEFVEWSVESQILDFEKFKWASDDKALVRHEAPVRQVRSAIYTVVWRKESNFVPTEFADLVGSVHNTIFRPPAFPNQTWQRETMLLVPTIGKGGQLRYSPSITPPTIEKGFGYTCKWLVKLEPGSTWNKYFRQSVAGATPTYESIKRYSDDKEVKSYVVKNHLNLLPP